MQERLIRLAGVASLCCLACLVIAPIVSLVLASVSSSRAHPFAIQGSSLTLEWYREALTNKTLVQAARNSLFISSIAAPIATLFGIIAAWASARFLTNASGIYVAAIVAPAIFPAPALALGLLWYFRAIDATGSLPMVVGTHAAYGFPYAYFAIYARYRQLDPTIESAARGLGASGRQVFATVVLPRLWRGIIPALLLAFLVSWDEYIITWHITVFNPTLPTWLYGSLGTSFTPAIYATGSLAVAFSSAIVMTFVAVLVLRGADSKNA